LKSAPSSVPTVPKGLFPCVGGWKRKPPSGALGAAFREAVDCAKRLENEKGIAEEGAILSYNNYNFDY
jgi:hypothetical protein